MSNQQRRACPTCEQRRAEQERVHIVARAMAWSLTRHTLHGDPLDPQERAIMWRYAVRARALDRAEAPLEQAARHIARVFAQGEYERAKALEQDARVLFDGKASAITAAVQDALAELVERPAEQNDHQARVLRFPTERARHS